MIPEKLNANSLQIFAKQLSSLEQAYGDINRLTIVCNRVEQNAEHRDIIKEIKSAYSLPVFEIPKRTDLSQSIGEGVSVFGFGKENQRVEDARDLFDEIADLFDETFEKTPPPSVKHETWNRTKKASNPGKAGEHRHPTVRVESFVDKS